MGDQRATPVGTGRLITFATTITNTTFPEGGSQIGAGRPSLITQAIATGAQVIAVIIPGARESKILVVTAIIAPLLPVSP